MLVFCSLFFFFRLHVFFVVLLQFVVVTHSSAAINTTWEEWKMKHSKVYDNEVQEVFCVVTDVSRHGQIFRLCGLFFFSQTEFSYRRAVWTKNMNLVLKHNQEAAAGKHSFTLGLNPLSDMVPV